MLNQKKSRGIARPALTTGLDTYFQISARGSTLRTEIIAGLTTFLAMVYSVIVVPKMLGTAGFDPGAVFVAIVDCVLVATVYLAFRSGWRLKA